MKPEAFVPELKDAFAANGTNAAIAGLWATNVLRDIQQNQAYLLGAKVSASFDSDVTRSAEILRAELETAIARRPPNKLLLPYQANNAGVAMRLAGKSREAGQLLDRALAQYPDLLEDLAELRSTIYLQEGKDKDALDLLDELKGRAELQIMASEIEAKIGKEKEALARIDVALLASMSDRQKVLALSIKGRIAIRLADRKKADEAADELAADFAGSPELLVFRSAYDRAFEIKVEANDEDDDLSRLTAVPNDTARSLLNSIADAETWDFATRLQTAEELLARGHAREAATLLRDKVSLSKESVALQILCDACVSAGMGTLAKEIADSFSADVKTSVFGQRFLINVAYMNGEVAKAVPICRKLFEDNPNSIRTLSWYVQSLLRMSDNARIHRLAVSLDDDKLVGTLSDKREYVNLLVFCGELQRARTFAYRLFFENRNDHRAWMALSSSVLAFGRPQGADDVLDLQTVGVDAAVVVRRPNGTEQTFVIESDSRVYSLRDENLSPDHPIAKAATGLRSGDRFVWPANNDPGEATILSVKHKAVDAFHFVLRRFEEQFPGIAGFKSVSFDPAREDGLEEMKAVLQHRAEYAQLKADEYSEGKYPLVVLAHHLGIDVISAFVGLFHECGVRPKVSSCSREDQGKAEVALARAHRKGIIADAVACYLIRRLGIERVVEKAFGKIGVTQSTIDIFAKRLHDVETERVSEDEEGRKASRTIGVQDGRILLTEMTETELNDRLGLMRSDLSWLKTDCVLIPAVARTDPDQSVISLRRLDFGGFVDDLLAADGSGRVLLSDDFHTRQLGLALFGIDSSWLQALLFHLEEHGFIEMEEAVQSTIKLCEVGEEALSITSARICLAATMLNNGALRDRDFAFICDLVGQPGAEMNSHIPITASILFEIWEDRQLKAIRDRVSSILLRKLVRNCSGNYREVLAALKRQFRSGPIRNYIDDWQTGHFLR